MKKPDFKKINGLIPAIVQHFVTGRVLMLGFMNEEAYQKTLATGRVWFYSRTRKQLWMKGETSGNELLVFEVFTDCDRDALLIQADPKGPTCHTGALSCFGDGSGGVLDQLSSVILRRKKILPKNSYTASLFRDGLDKICAKVEEESDEVIRAAQQETKQRLTEESADLLYHLLVLLAEKGVDFSAVLAELYRRQ